MNFLVAIILVFTTTSQTKRADVKVFVTEDRYQASLWVYLTHDKNQAKDSECIWYECADQYAANTIVRYVESKYEADVIIWNTPSPYNAGWKKEHRLKGHLKFK